MIESNASAVRGRGGRYWFRVPGWSVCRVLLQMVAGAMLSQYQWPALVTVGVAMLLVVVQELRTECCGCCGYRGRRQPANQKSYGPVVSDDRLSPR